MKESGEMYLETIYVLQQKGGVRAMDVADHMNFSRPSVTRGVGLLKDAGLVTTDAKGYLVLTEQGEARARDIYERHVVLTSVLEWMGVSHDIAVEDACKMEHVISEETFMAIKKSMENCCC